MSEIIFSIENFYFRYPLSDSSISFNGNIEIYENETVLLTGASGSGKSTFLYSLRGIIPFYLKGDYRGKILFKNIELNRNNIAKIGFLFQNPDSQIIHKKVFSELALSLENRKFTKSLIERNIKEIANKFEISHLLDRDFSTLSGGEKQKISLLSVILSEPEVLLLDEPTAFLDPESVDYFMRNLSHVIKGKTTILIEHNLHYLENKISRVIDFNNYTYTDSKITREELEVISKTVTGKTIFSVTNLHFKYKSGIDLYYNLDFDLKEGEIVSIIGKNGTGKTTLLKILSGLLKPNKGSIKLYDNEFHSIGKKELYSKIALLWQNPEYHFIGNTVFEECDNIGLLKKYNLEMYKDKNPFTLSWGEKRRLSLAILQNLDRKIFLLDEPTFGQDIKNLNILMQQINQMSNEGISFVIVTHNMEFANKISHRVLKLESGVLHEKN
ncbi:MAG: ABC transporter ATP-binding protein [Candidatus Delongbacteria bacterium]|nr:ABC transporter ATP-binding protein [Candidatus Delongbacteria bacterium]MBN2835233.1 ABC transporter ATP-binding protein [Candidatus Delongbacteria bacterium]